MRAGWSGPALLTALLAWGWFPATPAPLGDALPPLDAACVDEVLLAAPELKDPDLGGAVVLICGAGPGGAIGLVLNRAAEETWRDVAGLSPRDLALAGGPVGRPQALILYRDEGDALRWTTRALGIPFPGPGWARRPRVRERQVLAVLRGYVGWGPGQLDAELDAGAWWPAETSGASVLAVPLEERTAARWAGDGPERRD